MKTTVDKQWLIGVVNANKLKHRATFLAVQEKFRTKVIEEFEKRLANARANRQVDLYVHLSEPKDQTKDYERIIGMLENSTEKDITLDEKDYSRYVNDNWDWKEQWKSVSSSYGVEVDD